MGALSGFRLIQLRETTPIATAASLLADLGMDVIHLAQPDVARSERGTVEDAAYDVRGRNKRSIMLDLRSEAGRNAFYRLARTADVVLESNRPGATKRLGIDYETVRAIAPGIVYCSISGHGQTGPYANMFAYDPEACAAGGATATNVDDNGQVVPFGVLLGDGSAALHAAFAIEAALLHRERTGQGQYIDVSMTACMLTYQQSYAAEYLRTGYFHRENLALASLFRCQDDRYISSTNPTPDRWAIFCRAIGLPELEDRPSYPGWSDLAWRSEVLGPIRQRFLTKPGDEWLSILREAGCAVALVMDMDEVFHDPQILHRGLVLELQHPTLGLVRQPGFPIQFSETPAEVRRFSPQAGGDTEEILRELGCTSDEIAEVMGN
jgi:crotonobetainyl-CoA:carnitine CoA-transferase CaiB-like acyl-CoA transferase